MERSQSTRIHKKHRSNSSTSSNVHLPYFSFEPADLTPSGRSFDVGKYLSDAKEFFSNPKNYIVFTQISKQPSDHLKIDTYPTPTEITKSKDRQDRLY